MLTFKYLKEKCKKVVVLKGNHDNYLENIATKEEILVLEYYIWKDYCFLHGDIKIKEMEGKGIRYWIMGHVHPAVTLRKGAKSERYKCFLKGKYKKKVVVILPSFFPLVEGSDVLDKELNVPWKFDVETFEVAVVGENLEVLNFGKLSKLRKAH